MDSSEDIRDILKKVRQVEIRTRRLVSEAMVGAYHSSFKGQGMDFEEVREYAAGDDVRSIDWNVTAKMDRPFVKLYGEERELTLMLMVDVSASGCFGSGEQSKRELAAEVASVLAFSAVRNNDKVGLILFTDHVEKFIPAKKGRTHVLRVIREILFHQPREKGTDIAYALDYMNRLMKRRSLCFLISDCLPNHGEGAQEAFLNALALTNRRHDCVTLMLSDPREFEMPNVGVIALEDAESGEVVEVDTGSARVRELYAAHNQERSAVMMKALVRRGVDVVPISTGKPYVEALRRFFQKRGARR